MNSESKQRIGGEDEWKPSANTVAARFARNAEGLSTDATPKKTGSAGKPSAENAATPAAGNTRPTQRRFARVSERENPLNGG